MYDAPKQPDFLKHFVACSLNFGFIENEFTYMVGIVTACLCLMPITDSRYVE